MIYQWSLKRVGATMTLTGKDAQGKPVKVTSVETVENQPLLRARTKSGGSFALAA